MNVDNIRRILRSMEKRQLVGEPYNAFGVYSDDPHGSEVYYADEVSQSLVRQLCLELLVEDFELSSDLPGGRYRIAQVDDQIGEALILADLIELAQELVAPLDGDKIERQDQKPLRDAVKETTLRLEKDLISRALKECDGNFQQTAKRLKISEASLRSKIRDLEIKIE